MAIDANPGTRPVPSTVILRTDGPLVFASIDPVLTQLRERTLDVDDRPRLVVLDFTSTPEIDVTAVTALAGVVSQLQAAGIEVRFAGAHANVRDYVARLGRDERAPLAGKATIRTRRRGRRLPPRTRQPAPWRTGPRRG